MAHPSIAQHSTAQRGTAHQHTSCSQQLVAALSQQNAFAPRNKPCAWVPCITPHRPTPSTHRQSTTHLLTVQLLGHGTKDAALTNAASSDMTAKPYSQHSLEYKKRCCTRRNSLRHSKALLTAQRGVQEACCTHRSSRDTRSLRTETASHLGMLHSHTHCARTLSRLTKKPVPQRHTTPERTPWTKTPARQHTCVLHDTETTAQQTPTHTQAQCTQHITHHTCCTDRLRIVHATQRR